MSCKQFQVKLKIKLNSSLRQIIVALVYCVWNSQSKSSESFNFKEKLFYSHVLRIRKEHYDEINRQHVQKVGKVGSFSNLLDETVKKALEKRDYLEFTKGIDGAHAAIHNNLKCTTAYATTTAYGSLHEV